MRIDNQDSFTVSLSSEPWAGGTYLTNNPPRIAVSILRIVDDAAALERAAMELRALAHWLELQRERFVA